MIDRPMLHRFRELADTYGGTIARWPESDRDAAMRIASEPAAAEILARAMALDATLDTWRVLAPSSRLRDRIAGTAPQRHTFALRARLWWSGIGIAAALTGATAGAAAVSILMPIEIASDSATSFGDVAGPGSDR